MGRLTDLIPDLPEEEGQADPQPKWITSARQQDYTSASGYVLTILGEAPEKELHPADRLVLQLAALVHEYAEAEDATAAAIGPPAIVDRCGLKEATAKQVLARLVRLGALEWAVPPSAGRRFARIPREVADKLRVQSGRLVR